MKLEDFDLPSMKVCRLNNIQERDLAEVGVEYRTVDGSICKPGLFFHKESGVVVGAVVYSVGAQCQVLNWKATMEEIRINAKSIRRKNQSA